MLWIRRQCCGYAVLLIPTIALLILHGGESPYFRGLKMADTCQNPVNSGKTFCDISVNTDQIGMGFEADTSKKKKKNESNMSILATFGKRSG